MPKKITVVISQGQSNNPAKRELEEDLVAALVMEPHMEAAIVPHLYDLSPESTGMLCLENIKGNMVVLSWLYPRAAHWILDRSGIKGHAGTTLLTADESEDEEDELEEAAEESRGIGPKDVPDRTIFCVDMRAAKTVEPFLEEIRRIAEEMSTETVGLMDWLQGSPQPEQLERYLNPGKETGGNGNGNSHQPLPIVQEGNVARVEEKTGRRWYPVIDFSRCTNCMECLDFCLFGVYGVDQADTILVEQPDNCKKGCPACSRVCPENAIIFPQHKTPAIAGSPVLDGGGGLKIDLSKLFGAPEASPLDLAVAERDRELVADGRDAVGMSVGIPKRQEDREQEPRDELDDLIDELDDLDL